LARYLPIFAAMTSTPELTTRDVLHQIARRLALIEEDVRALHMGVTSGFQRLDTRIDTIAGRLDAKIDKLDLKIDTKVGDAYHRLDAKLDARFGELDAKIDTQITRLETKNDTRFSRLDAKIDTQITRLEAKIDTHLRWTLGMVLASWLSLMGAVLLK